MAQSSPGRRLALLAALGLHAAAILLGLSMVSPFPAPEEAEPLLLLTHAPTAAEPPLPTLVPLPMIVDPASQAQPLAPELSIARTDISPDAAQPVAQAAACAPGGQIEQALGADPAIQLAAASAPRESRSVAEAIIVWNQGWSAVADAAAAPLAPVRIIVQRELARLPADCAAEPVLGPRFVAVATAHGTTLFVFGSGRWAWRDLLAAG